MCDILKCPYCGGILEQTFIYNINAYACTNLACKGYFMTATKDMWQELILKHKALEIAIDALNYANKCIKGGCVNWETEIDRALEQITALTKGGDNE